MQINNGLVKIIEKAEDKGYVIPSLILNLISRNGVAYE